MSSSATYLQTSFLRKTVAKLHALIDGMYVAATNWRKPATSLQSPSKSSSKNVGEETSDPKGAAMSKRTREEYDAGEDTLLLKRSTSVARDLSSRHSAAGQHEAERVMVSRDVVFSMQELARYRKKLEMLSARSHKWSQRVRDCEEGCAALERQISKLTSADTLRKEALIECERRLERGKARLNDSAARVHALQKRIEIFESNIEAERNDLERQLHGLLVRQGHFQAAVTDSEASNHSASSRVKDQPRSNSGWVEKDPEHEADPEAEKKQAAIARLYNAQYRYQVIENLFEDRSAMYRDDLEEWKRLTAAGQCSITRTDFDVSFCARYGDLGIDLHEAAIARSVAAQEIMELKARSATYSQTSNFADHPADAIGLATETEMAMAAFDATKVHQWLDVLQETDSAEQPAEGKSDDWEVKSLQFGESCNGVAAPWTKVRLNRWNRARQILWERMRKDLHGDKLPVAADE